MNLIHPEFADKGTLPERFICNTKEGSPMLRVEDVPPYTRSLALIVDEINPVEDRRFLLWSVWDIDAHTKSISSKSLPEGAVQGKNVYGTFGYGAPCPPEKGVEHNCRFRLFALSKRLDIPPESMEEEVEAAMAGHILEKDEVVVSVKK